MIMLLQGRDAAAKQEFETALRIDGSLKAGLENSIDQIMKTRKAKRAVGPF